MINHDDVMGQLAAAGLLIDKPLNLDGRIQRWKMADGDRERRGWSRLREWTSRAGHTYIVGAFGVWQGNNDGYTKIELPKRDESRPALSPEDLAAIRAASKAAAHAVAEERKREAKTAARWAAAVWQIAKPCQDHDYLAAKGVKSHGLRVLEGVDGLVLEGVDEPNWLRLKSASGALLVPMHDVNGNVCGLQFIYPKGHPRRSKLERDKEFWPSGMAMGGTFGVIGPISRTGVLLVAEGYATAASLHEATGYSAVYAFSANNLGKAGKLLRRAFPALRLLVCADDDYLTDGNPGCKAAAEATAEIEHSAWVKPDFSDDAGADRRGGKKLTDYNDLLALDGGITLRLASQIHARLDALGWRDAKQVRAPSTPGGEGESVADGRPAARSVMSLDELVERFIPIDDGTGKYIWDTWTRKIAHRDQLISLLPAGVRQDDLKRHAVWMSRGGAYIDEIGFDPSETDPKVKLNTWRGWPRTPKAGDCSMLLDTLYYLCGDEPNKDEVYRWLLCWMAYPLQHPGAKLSSAVIMHGPQGTGKTTVFKALAAIYGDYSVVLNQRGLEDKFNSDWADSKLLILAEEIVTRSEMWHIKNELKDLVTGDTLRVNTKNVAAYYQTNRVQVVYLSNEDQPLPIENDDRRHLVVYNPPPQPESFYRQLYRELQDGGIDAFYHHLLNLDLTGFDPSTRPPMTRAKKALQELALPSEIRFALAWLAGDTDWPVCPCLSSDFYAAYLRWCRANGEQRPRASNHFHRAVENHIQGWEKRKVRAHTNTHYQGQTKSMEIIFPPPPTAEEAKGHDPEHHLQRIKPEAKSAQQWITDGYITFAAAFGGQGGA